MDAPIYVVIVKRSFGRLMMYDLLPSESYTLE